MLEEPPLRDTEPSRGGLRRQQLVDFDVASLVRCSRFGHGREQDRVHVSGQMMDLPAEIHDDGPRQSDEDTGLPLDVDQRGYNPRLGGAV